MTFALPDYWVWDFWTADDGDQFHLYYLHAPTSLGDPHLRHRNARIGHAVSDDLRTWRDLGPCLLPGESLDVDADATWTGSVVRGDDGGWRMFYTGSRFLEPVAHVNIETVALAVSDDLHHWHKQPAASISAPLGRYETLGTSEWHEEAWRDPYVLRESDGSWSMLITARSIDGDDELDRGVVATATSSDLEQWTIGEPLTAPGGGFAHLEVPQIVTVDGRRSLLFSCDTPALAGARRTAGERGGIWVLDLPDGQAAPYDASMARLLVDESLYAGRAVQDRAGDWYLMAFQMESADGEFGGSITDPIPLVRDPQSGALVLMTTEVTR